MLILNSMDDLGKKPYAHMKRLNVEYEHFVGFHIITTSAMTSDRM